MERSCGTCRHWGADGRDVTFGLHTFMHGKPPHRLCGRIDDEQGADDRFAASYPVVDRAFVGGYDGTDLGLWTLASFGCVLYENERSNADRLRPSPLDASGMGERVEGRRD